MKVPMNLGLEQEIKEKLQIIAKEQGLKPSHIVTIWVNEYWKANKEGKINNDR